MHAWILGATLLATVAPAAAANCPQQTGTIVERFISADCAQCWASIPGELVNSKQWLFDWIVPSSLGEVAPLSPAAPAESGDRARRLTGGEFADGQSATHQTKLGARKSLRLSVSSGPAWNGYFGVQFDASGPVPRSATGWVGLVEIVPEGTDGTPVVRNLVRSIAGPLDLATLHPGRPIRALLALRWPETAQPERLRARAWIESADGRLIAIADEGCPRR